jgi:hypothetical protein
MRLRHYLLFFTLYPLPFTLYPIYNKRAVSTSMVPVVALELYPWLVPSTRPSIHTTSNAICVASRDSLHCSQSVSGSAVHTKRWTRVCYLACLHVDSSENSGLSGKR